MEEDPLSRVASATARIRSAHARSHHGRYAIHGNATLVDPAPTLPAIGYVHRPFTSAVLNPAQQDILDFVRDADEVEASLFAPPAIAPAAPAAAAQRIIRAPPRRAPPPPPTPLKPQAQHNLYSSSALLQTASKLAAGQEGMARVNNTISSLTAKSQEIALARRRFHAHTMTMQAALDEYRRTDRRTESKENNDPTSAAPISKPKASIQTQSSQHEEEVAMLKQALKQEELELFAIEQLKRDLLDQTKRKLSSPAKPFRPPLGSRKATSPSPVSVPQPEQETSTILDESFPLASPTKDTSSCRPPNVPETAAPEPSSTLETETREHPEPEDGALDTALVPPTAESTDEGNGEEPLPSSTPELERISEKIWALWGPTLSYVWPGRSTGDFNDTLTGLEVLLGRRAGSETGARLPSSVGETSVPPRANDVVSAFVLATLLRAPEPHTVEFDHFKVLAGNWWDGEGRARMRQILQPYLPEEEVQRELDHAGEPLLTRAVYSMQAKRLLMIRRKAGKSPVGFAGL